MKYIYLNDIKEITKIAHQNNTFVEPYLPNYKIGIMHLAAGIWKDSKDMRTDKTVLVDIKTGDSWGKLE